MGMGTGRLGATASMVACTLIWGGSFVAQRSGGDAAGPFGFTLARAAIAVAMLLPFALAHGASDIKRALKPGALCGLILFTSQSFQQVGMFMGTSAGKAGFITSSSLLFVPIFETVLGNKCPRKIWIATIAAFFGLYLLCVRDGLTVEPSDMLVLGCAMTWAMQVMAVSRAVRAATPTSVVLVQFATCFLLSLPASMISDIPDAGGIIGWLALFTDRNVLIAALYAGVLANGVAYVLQGIGQRVLSTTITALIMSLEAVFAALAGAAILGESLTAREIAGSAVLLVTVILAQVPIETLISHERTRLGS